jgi:hypothetical protein
MASVYDRIIELADQLDPLEKARLAAELLNDAEVSRDTWRVFADALTDTNHGELLARAADERDRS